MNRTLSWTVMVVLAACMWAAPVGADSYPVERVIEDGRLLVSVRQVGELLEAQVQWSEPTRGIALRRPAVLVVLQVDLPRAWVSGRERSLDVPPRLIGGRVYVPLRFLAESLGVRVDYHGDHLELIRADGQSVRVHLQPPRYTGH